MIVYSEYASGKYLVDDKHSTKYSKSGDISFNLNLIRQIVLSLS